MLSLKKKNLPICLGVLGGFSVMAYVANVILDYNYMFLMYHDGTPYSIFYNMVGGSPVLYPIVVVLLFVAYIALFYLVHYLVMKWTGKTVEEQATPEQEPQLTH